MDVKLYNSNDQFSNKKPTYSQKFTFYEFIDSLFTEDNDLSIQEYYDTI